MLESLYMGCVSYSLRFFPKGRVDKKGLREAELAARKELQTIVHRYQANGLGGGGRFLRLRPRRLSTCSN